VLLQLYSFFEQFPGIWILCADILEQSVPKCQHIPFRCWEITQKKEYNRFLILYTSYLGHTDCCCVLKCWSLAMLAYLTNILLVYVSHRIPSFAWMNLWGQLSLVKNCQKSKWKVPSAWMRCALYRVGEMSAWFKRKPHNLIRIRT
jgi:hypothetical protein